MGDLRRCYLVLALAISFACFIAMGNLPRVLFVFVYRLRLPFGPLLRSNISEIQERHVQVDPRVYPLATVEQ